MKKLKIKTISHCYRVACLCDEICKKRGFNKNIHWKSVMAGFLHDIMKNREEKSSFYYLLYLNPTNHAKEGKELAKNKIKLDKKTCNAIGDHNLKHKKIIKKDNISKIVFIADKIDKKEKKEFKNYSNENKTLFSEFEASVFSDIYTLDECIEKWFEIKKNIKKQSKNKHK